MEIPKAGLDVAKDNPPPRGGGALETDPRRLLRDTSWAASCLWLGSCWGVREL